jgi:tricorn protease
MSRRMVALNVPEENYRQLKAAAEGVLFFRRAGAGGAGDTLVRYSLEDREAADFAGGVIDFAVTADGQKLMYETMEAWHVVDADSPPEPGSGQLDVNGLQMKVEPAGEWRQIFRDAWRFQRDFLYVENFHGADWDKVWEMYEPWVKHVRHRSDLTYLMDMMAGEIGVGHSFTGGGDAPDVSSVSVGLLGADYEIVKDRYRIQRIYTAENWNPDLEAPLSVPGIKVSEGDFILEVNGRQLTGADNIYSLFEATAGRQTTLRIGSGPKDKDALTVKVVPVPNEFDLRRRAWVEDNRRRVDELSGGRLAYVYLPNTAGAGYTYFNRYYFAQQDRDGVVVDERFNGGGSAADYMIDIMKRELHGFFNNPSRERQPDTSPIAGIWGPKVMIINESAGSGGDYLPYMFRKTGIGPLVGTRTWGGLVGIWDTPQLVDGGFITAPRGGFFSTSGQWEVENEGVAPDIHVEQWPKEVAAGGDPQLERAVAEAMRLLEDWESPMIPEPAPPVRVKAPTR